MTGQLFPTQRPAERAPRAHRRHLYPITDAGEPGFKIPAGTRWVLVACGIHDAWQAVPAKDAARWRAECSLCSEHQPADPPDGHVRWSPAHSSTPPASPE